MSLSENVSETSLDTDMQKIRRQNLNKLKHKENTLISKTDEFEMIDIGENEYVIEPWSFDANTYSLLPAFQKSKLSIGVLASASAIFCQMGVPKNKISTVYDGEGFPISRDQLTGGINCFARAFLSNVARQIKKNILVPQNQFSLMRVRFWLWKQNTRSSLKGKTVRNLLSGL